MPALHINLSSDLWSQTDDGTSGSGGIVPIIPTVSSPESQSVKSGTNTTFQVTASGGNPNTYTYQWYYATSETGAGTRIGGAVSSKYTIPSSEMTVSMSGRYYYCMVSNGIYNVESQRTRILVYNETNPGSGSGGSGTQGSLKTQVIQASSYTKEYGSKAFNIQASTNGNGRLTYQSSNKKAVEVSSGGRVKIKGYGTAIITIHASQTPEYKAASKQINIEVIPKTIKLKKVSSPGSRRISINWKKGKKIKGYELYISSSKTFKSNTFRRAFGRSKTNTALIGLKSGKKYYVKIRSYAKVGKKKYYSEWSKVKQVKIK